MSEMCPGEPGWVNGYVIGPGYNDFGGMQRREGAPEGSANDDSGWYVPVGRSHLDTMFCSFNPGTDEARQKWYEKQMQRKAARKAGKRRYKGHLQV